jgi:hypothetical protein
VTTPHDQLPAVGPDDEPWPSDTVLPAHAPGRRAKPAGGSPLGKVLLVLGVALVCSLALLGAWVTLGDDADPVAAPSAEPTAPASSAAPTPSPSASQTPAASASPSASATPAASRPASASASASASATKPVFEVDRSVPVTVLNGTSRSGLAARVAADLRAKGWTVVSVGNWRGGGVDSTTVFIVGNRDAAATMRRDIPSADLTTGPIGLMKRDRITVVVMDDYKA